MKALLLNVCYGTAKLEDIVSRGMLVATGHHADCAERSFCNGLFLTQPSQR